MNVFIWMVRTSNIIFTSRSINTDNLYRFINKRELVPIEFTHTFSLMPVTSRQSGYRVIMQSNGYID